MTDDDRQQRLLNQFLSQCETSCPACGYNLFQLTASRCPECGEQLLLQVACAEPKMAARIAGVIGLAAGAGLNGLLIVYALIRSICMGDHIVHEIRFLTVVGSGFVVEASALLLFLRLW